MSTISGYGQEVLYHDGNSTPEIIPKSTSSNRLIPKAERAMILTRSNSNLQKNCNILWNNSCKRNILCF